MVLYSMGATWNSVTSTARCEHSAHPVISRVALTTAVAIRRRRTHSYRSVTTQNHVRKRFKFCSFIVNRHIALVSSGTHHDVMTPVFHDSAARVCEDWRREASVRRLGYRRGQLSVARLLLGGAGHLARTLLLLYTVTCNTAFRPNCHQHKLFALYQHKLVFVINRSRS